MGKPLQAASIVAPGFFGLNTQESGVTLEAGFALTATNCVIDKFGRLGTRRGWQYRTTELDSVEGDNVGINLKGLRDFVDLAGVKTYLSWSEDKFYKGYNDLTELTPTTDDTVENGNWQVVTLNDRAYYFQRGYKPLYYSNETSSEVFEMVEDHPNYTGTVPQANTVLSAYGRLWAADTNQNKTTVYFSDLLDGARWNSGSAGSINITGTFTKGSDTIVGLGAHNGNLIVFCKNSIIIFQDNDSFQASFDVTTLSLVEVIEGVGCIARDSIEHIGDDILFLSSTGVRSLGRTIQEKSQPMRDLSKNIRDDLSTLVANEADLTNIKAVYAPNYAFYLLAFPASGFVYCFDTRVPLEDGSLRVTLWDFLYHKDYLYDKETNQLLMAQEDGIAEYFGFLDNGETYRFQYFTNYFDLGQGNTTKIVKKIGTTLIAPQGQEYVVKIGFDYAKNYTTYPYFLGISGDLSEYGVNEYAIAEYNGGLLIENIKAPVGGSGVVLQAGIEADIKGAPLSVQRLDVFVKLGRVI